MGQKRWCLRVFLHSEMNCALKSPFHLQWWHLIHLRFVLCLGEVKFRLSTCGRACGKLSYAWLVHAVSRYLVYAKALRVLSPIRGDTRAESILVLEKAPCFCNRPTLCWGDRINIFCASAFFHHCLFWVFLFVFFTQSSPECVLPVELGSLPAVHARLARVWEARGRQVSGSTLPDRNHISSRFFRPI